MFANTIQIKSMRKTIYNSTDRLQNLFPSIRQSPTHHLSKMQISTLALVSAFAVVVSAQVNAAPSPATTLGFSSTDSAENPEDIKQLLQKKCPDEKCPKPRHITVTKNITKVQQKTVTKTLNC